MTDQPHFRDDRHVIRHAVECSAIDTSVDFQKLEDVAVIVASREAPPEPIQPPQQTPGTETDPQETAAKLQAAKQQILDAQQQVLDAQRQQLQQAREQAGLPATDSPQYVDTPIDRDSEPYIDTPIERDSEPYVDTQSERDDSDIGEAAR